MRTKIETKFSSMSGRNDEKRLHNVIELTRMIATDCKNGNLDYMFNCLSGAWLDANNVDSKLDNEETKDFINRKLSEIRNEFAKKTDEEIKEMELYKIFTSKNRLWQICREFMVSYWVQTDEDKQAGRDGKQIFAHEVKFGVRASDLTKDDYVKYSTSPHWVKTIVSINTDDNFTDKITYFFKKGYEINETERLQRIRKFGKPEMMKTTYRKNGSFYILEESDKLNLSQLYSFVSYHLQLSEIKRNMAEKQETERLERVAKMAEIENEKRAELVVLDEKLGGLLQLKRNKTNISSVNKILRDIEKLRKFIEFDDTKNISDARLFVAKDETGNDGNTSNDGETSNGGETETK